MTKSETQRIYHHDMFDESVGEKKKQNKKKRFIIVFQTKTDHIVTGIDK
jgi:hypothetical protein